MSAISPVHMPVNFKIRIEINKAQKKKIVFRNKRHLNKEELIVKIVQGIEEDPRCCVHGMGNIRACQSCFTTLFKEVAKREYEAECPLIRKEIIVKENAPWYNYEIASAKRAKRSKERRWRRIRTDEAKKEYCDAKNALNTLIRRRKREYYRQKIEEIGSDVGRLYNIINNITGNKKKNNYQRVS